MPNETHPFARLSSPLCPVSAPLNLTQKRLEEYKEIRYSPYRLIDTEDMSHIVAVPIERGGSDRRLFSNRHGDLFDIVPFGTHSHYFTRSPPQTPAKLTKPSELHRPGLVSPPQTPVKSTRRCELGTIRRYSGLRLPRTPLTPTNLRHFSVPQRCSVIPPQTPVKPTRHYQLSKPRSSSALVLPLTPTTLAEPLCPDITRHHPVSGLRQESHPEFAGFHPVKPPETHSTFLTPSQSNIQSTRLTHAGKLCHRSVSTSPPQTPLRSNKASRCLRPRPRKTSISKLRMSKSAKTSRPHRPAGGLQPQKSPGVMDFINLTSDDSTKILTGVAPSGNHTTKARRKGYRKQSSGL